MNSLIKGGIFSKWRIFSKYIDNKLSTKMTYKIVMNLLLMISHFFKYKYCKVSGYHDNDQQKLIFGTECLNT